MLKITPYDVKTFFYAAALLCILQLVSSWPLASNSVLPESEYEDIDLQTSKRHWNSNLNSWGKRAWQNLQGGWGKRNVDPQQYQQDPHTPKNPQGTSWNRRDELNDSQVPFEEIAALLDRDEHSDSRNPLEELMDQQANEFTSEGKRGWSRLPTWGKRAKWNNNIGGAWGKKDPAWTNLKGIWGKRNYYYHDEPKM